MRARGQERRGKPCKQSSQPQAFRLTCSPAAPSRLGGATSFNVAACGKSRRYAFLVVQGRRGSPRPTVTTRRLNAIPGNGVHLPVCMQSTTGASSGPALLDVGLAWGTRCGSGDPIDIPKSPLHSDFFLSLPLSSSALLLPCLSPLSLQLLCPSVRSLVLMPSISAWRLNSAVTDRLGLLRQVRRRSQGFPVLAATRLQLS